jgi:hypothetical protein
MPHPFPLYRLDSLHLPPNNGQSPVQVGAIHQLTVRQELSVKPWGRRFESVSLLSRKLTFIY